MFKCRKCFRMFDPVYAFDELCEQCSASHEGSPAAMSRTSEGLAAPSGKPELAASPLAAPESDSAASLPDIGLDPLKYRDDVEGGLEGAKKRLRHAVGLQQMGVPDQTMLAWRIDVSRVLDELTLMTARWEILSGKRAADAHPAVEERAGRRNGAR